MQAIFVCVQQIIVVVRYTLYYINNLIQAKTKLNSIH